MPLFGNKFQFYGCIIFFPWLPFLLYAFFPYKLLGFIITSITSLYCLPNDDAMQVMSRS